MASIGTMQGKTGKRIKIYLVVGLASVLAALVYRHLHKKPVLTQSPLQATASTTLSVVPEFPELERKGMQKAQVAIAVDKESRRGFIRDIFAPLISLPRAGRRSKEPQSRAQRGNSLKLKGVIVGGRNPIAIINDTFVRLGERINGYQVVRIEKKEVLLRSGNHTIHLKLASNE